MTSCPPPSGVAAGRLVSTGLADEPIFLMARAASIGSSEANRRLANLGLKVRHYSVLAIICNGEEPTQRELGGVPRLGSQPDGGTHR